ncbi:uncharacterized protein with HEPN domain [Lewinella antarctica]|uniref:Uncharacterized protein with HEPN domain n=1 Tax=Neolewinella antarctica TaxID=442734 RepID=A0ABX0XFT4_9BACT|nr:uncharacterized protein with HEPN domain [Neolewinella antarctica]
MAKRKIPETVERLQHIAQAIDDIYAFTAAMTLGEFTKERQFNNCPICSLLSRRYSSPFENHRPD